jgi:hypothetical protein
MNDAAGPRTEPPWDCKRCGQRNSGWAESCGRCNWPDPPEEAARRDSQPDALDWPTLANIIREVDGNHDLGAGELAERILTHPKFRLTRDQDAAVLALRNKAQVVIRKWESARLGSPFGDGNAALADLRRVLSHHSAAADDIRERHVHKLDRPLADGTFICYLCGQWFHATQQPAEGGDG